MAGAASGLCAWAFIAQFLSGCAGADVDANLGKGMACVDDSQTCVAERANALDRIRSDRGRAWVREPAPPAAYASGVRLFAFKTHKKELSCDELSIGRREAEAGPRVLRSQQVPGLTTAQVARGVMLAEEVHKELDNEYRRRCKA